MYCIRRLAFGKIFEFPSCCASNVWRFVANLQQMSGIIAVKASGHSQRIEFFSWSNKFFFDEKNIDFERNNLRVRCFHPIDVRSDSLCLLAVLNALLCVVVTWPRAFHKLAKRKSFESRCEKAVRETIQILLPTL